MSIVFVVTQDGVVGNVYVTTDGGANWILDPLPAPSRRSAIHGDDSLSSVVDPVVYAAGNPIFPVTEELAARLAGTWAFIGARGIEIVAIQAIEGEIFISEEAGVH